MKILVEQVNKLKELDYSLQKDWVKSKIELPNTEYNFTENINITLTLSKINNIIELKGTITSVVNLICPSCLENFDNEFKHTLDLKVIRIPEKDNKIIDNEEENPDIYYFNGNTLDLEPIILSEIIVNYPYDMLCTESCKGLCHICGINLNKNSCEHQNSKPKIKNSIWDQLMTSTTKGV